MVDWAEGPQTWARGPQGCAEGPSNPPGGTRMKGSQRPDILVDQNWSPELIIINVFGHACAHVHTQSVEMFIKFVTIDKPSYLISFDPLYYSVNCTILYCRNWNECYTVQCDVCILLTHLYLSRFT